MNLPDLSRDDTYLEIILRRLQTCKNYKPRFGQGFAAGLSLTEFQQLYSADAFYTWFGLDSPMIYAAHRAAGGITSVYRQIGIGCEEVFRQIIRDQLQFNAIQSGWFYEIAASSGKSRRLSLDARIETSDIGNSDQSRIFQQWLHEAALQMHIAPEIAKSLKGAVFEVRQGYKSKDSKRQNADIANAGTAYSQGYLPVVAILSTQIDIDIAYRYENARWLLLRGYPAGHSTDSIYAFTRDVLGYDLAQFFQTHHLTIKTTVIDILNSLLGANE